MRGCDMTNFPNPLLVGVAGCSVLVVIFFGLAVATGGSAPTAVLGAVVALGVGAMAAAELARRRR